jgi:hypothetical protein
MRYIHKSVSVEAIQWNGDNLNEIKELLLLTNASVKTAIDLKSIVIFREDGNSYMVPLGSWVIKRDSGCVYSCSKESFKNNYSPAFPIILS